jgi:hypothetical protein
MKAKIKKGKGKFLALREQPPISILGNPKSKPLISLVRRWIELKSRKLTLKSRT